MAERLKTEKEDRKAARAARAAKKRAAKKARKEKGLSDTDFNDLSDFSGDSSDLNEDDDAEPEFELPEEAREYLVRVQRFREAFEKGVIKSIRCYVAKRPETAAIWSRLSITE
jgi:hypothetical protein